MNKIYLVIEKGWSCGDLVLWACKSYQKAEYLKNLRPELRRIQDIELEDD